MGCPDRYYKKALQTFAYCLNFLSDKNRAKEMREEQNEKILENEIIIWKNKISEKQFYYDAGRTSELILNDADINDGCDGFNACIGGLVSFEEFIGIEDE